MRKSRKIVVALISFAGILLCLLIVLLVVLPQLINLETVKQEVKHLYASDTGGHIEYQHLNMAFFPRPHVVISDVSFTIPDNIQGTVDSVKIYPKMLPLLTGDLQISVVHTRSPEITIQVPETSKDEKTVRQPFLLETPGNWLKSVLEAIPALKIPSMAINARNGQIHFYRGQRRFWGLQGLSGQVEHKGRTIEFSAQCQSNFWENLTIKGRYAEAGFKLDSQMKLNQFRPHAVAEYLFPESSLKMTNARANLTVDLKTEGTNFLQADIQGALPYMYWRRANKELKLDDTRLQARILFDGGDLSLDLLQLDLTDPRLSLAGRLNINPGQPTIQLEIEGRQINVSTAQRMALALTEKADTVSNIFNILNEGDFQRITLNTQASDWAQLADKEKLVLRGKLVGGKLSIPVGSLELENVRGDATFANGILTGENVEAQMGNSFAKKGKLSIALTGATAPFRIEGLIQADLAELPAVLANLITNQRFQKDG